MWNRSVEWDAEDWRNWACRRHRARSLLSRRHHGAGDRADRSGQACLSGLRGIEPCLEFALATNQESGIWGGTSEEERRKLRKAWLAARRRAS